MVRLTIALALLLVISSALAKPSRSGGRGRDTEDQRGGGDRRARLQEGGREFGLERRQLRQGDSSISEDEDSSSSDDGFSSEEDGASSEEESTTVAAPESPIGGFPEPLRSFGDAARAAGAAGNRPAGNRPAAAGEDGSSHSGKRGRGRKGRRGPSGLGLVMAACSVVNATSGEVVRQRNCSEGVSCGLGPLTVPACDNTLFTLTFCDAPPPREDDEDEDEVVEVPEEDFEIIDDTEFIELLVGGNVEELDGGEDENPEAEEMRRHRRRPRGLPALACSLQGNGVDITRPCRGNDTCDLGSLTLPFNGTTVTAMFCKPEEGAESRPCPDHDREEGLEREGSRPREGRRDSERSGRRGGRGQRGEEAEGGATEAREGRQGARRRGRGGQEESEAAAPGIAQSESGRRRRQGRPQRQRRN